MVPSAIRTETIAIAKSAGLAIPKTLPLLEDELELRSLDETVSRSLCLSAVAATSYGFDSKKALAWLRQEKLETLLTDAELQFIQNKKGRAEFFQVQVEAIWALAWSFNLIPELNFWKDCDNEFVTMLPNLKANESGDKWRRNAKVRAIDVVVPACDLAYCLHWAVRQAQIEGKSPPCGLKAYVVVERRRALEWLLSKDAWDAISLDT